MIQPAANCSPSANLKDHLHALSISAGGTLAERGGPGGVAGDLRVFLGPARLRAACADQAECHPAGVFSPGGRAGRDHQWRAPHGPTTRQHSISEPNGWQRSPAGTTHPGGAHARRRGRLLARRQAVCPAEKIRAWHDATGSLRSGHADAHRQAADHLRPVHRLRRTGRPDYVWVFARFELRLLERPESGELQLEPHCRCGRSHHRQRAVRAGKDRGPCRFPRFSPGSYHL